MTNTLHGERIKVQKKTVKIYYRALLPALRARLFRPITDPIIFPGFTDSSLICTVFTSLVGSDDTRRFLDEGSSALLGAGFRALCDGDY